MTSPQGLDRTGLGAGLVCFLIWGIFPLMFHAMAHEGASAWEIVGWRTIFALIPAGGLVLATGRLGAVGEILIKPKDFMMLALSATLILSNWSLYVWAVNSGQTLSASLGYYINPLINAAVGALFFRERISRLGRCAIGFAALGVLVQALSIGAPPWVPLLLAASFSGYGVVRRQARADAQTGLFVECLILTPLAAILLFWLASHGGVRFGQGWAPSLWLILAGPATVTPLALFAFAARRLPFNVVGFLQFLTPTLQFACGLWQGERLSPLSLVAFGLIWTGVAIFTTDLVGQLRRETPAETGAATS